MVSGAFLLVAGLAAQHVAEDLVVIVEQGCREGAAALGQVGECAQRAPERDRAGQKPLLQQHPGEVATVVAAVELLALLQQVGQVRKVLLFVGVRREWDRLDAPGLEFLRGDLALQAAHGDIAQGGLIEVGAAGEPAVVDHLQQRGERLAVPVVRGGAEEQAMLAPFGQLPGVDGAQAVDGVAAGLPVAGRARRGDVVGLVDDQDVERVAPGGAPVVGVGVHLPQKTLGARRTQPRHRHDDTREEAERVGVQPVAATQLRHPFRVHDDEVETELLAHLVLPLDREAGRAKYDHAAGAVP